MYITSDRYEYMNFASIYVLTDLDVIVRVIIINDHRFKHSEYIYGQLYL
jgi:hypothetical protein